jgi:hypothetical protein
MELPTLEGLQKARLSFKTPKKVRLGSVLAPDTISVSNRSRGPSLTTMVEHDINDNEAAERIKIERALQIIMSDWDKLEANFHLIYTELRPLEDPKGCIESRFPIYWEKSNRFFEERSRQNATLGRQDRLAYHGNRGSAYVLKSSLSMSSAKAIIFIWMISGRIFRIGEPR